MRYLADNHFQPVGDTQEAIDKWKDLYHYGKRRGATVPPIHAPRWTSRLLLEKVAGRVEQLQRITEADAVAEGIEVDGLIDEYPVYKDYSSRNATWSWPAIESYRTLWESLHGPGSWEANPWLWVEKLKRIQ